MRIAKREPGYHYFDVFGGDKLDDIGQRQSRLEQYGTVVVALKNLADGTTCVTRKLYSLGIFTRDDDDGHSNPSSSSI